MLNNPFLTRSAFSNIEYRITTDTFKSTNYLPSNINNNISNYNYQNTISPYNLKTILNRTVQSPAFLHTSRSLYNSAASLMTQQNNNEEQIMKKPKQNPFLYKFPTRYIPKEQQKYNNLKGNSLSTWQRNQYINKYLNQSNIQKLPQFKENEDYKDNRENNDRRQYVQNNDYKNHKIQKQYSFVRQYDDIAPNIKNTEDQSLKNLSRPPIRSKESFQKTKHASSKIIRAQTSIYNGLPLNDFQKNDVPFKKSQSNDDSSSIIKKILNLQNQRIDNYQKTPKYTDSQVEPKNQTYQPLYNTKNNANEYQQKKQKTYQSNMHEDDNDHFDFNKNQQEESQYRKPKYYPDQYSKNNPYQNNKISKLNSDNYPKQIKINNVIYEMIELC